MWEQIRSNRRKSAVLVIAMALVLLGLGFGVGESLAPGAGIAGLAVAVLVWAVLALVGYFQGGKILMAATGARRISKEDHPRLFNVVEEMQIAAGLAKTPDIYIIDSPALNAFATGRDPDHAAVAVTAGLLAKLNRDQLQGVIAHEISHVTNRDILFMTLLGVMVGAIVIVAEVFLRSLRYGGGRRSRSSRGGGQGAALILILVIVFAILAPILARIIYFAASRRREYLADASGAILTRYPEGLASALEVLAGDSAPSLTQASRATAPLFIVNPLQSRSLSAMGLLSTHPPIHDRIRILRSMAGLGQVSFQAYQESLNAISGDRAGRMPASVLGLAGQPIRAAIAAEPPTAQPRVAREAYDAVRRAHGYRFLQCACGVRMKLDPTFAKPTVRCPRCHRTVPVAQAAEKSG